MLSRPYRDPHHWLVGRRYWGLQDAFVDSRRIDRDPCQHHCTLSWLLSHILLFELLWTLTRALHNIGAPPVLETCRQGKSLISLHTGGAYGEISHDFVGSTSNNPYPEFNSVRRASGAYNWTLSEEGQRIISDRTLSYPNNRHRAEVSLWYVQWNDLLTSLAMSDNNPTTSSTNAMAEKVEQSGKPAQDPGSNDVEGARHKTSA